METNLTKYLKTQCHTYKPRIPTSLRIICWAEEVPMPNGGIVDVIRFEDEYASVEHTCGWNKDCPYTARRENGCHGCIYVRRRFGPVRPLCTCYEVKISMRDFHSGHGTNFFGQENYFVVPKEIEQTICASTEHFFPHVGVLSLHGRYLRLARPCIRQEVAEGTMLQLMYTAFKSSMKSIPGNQPVHSRR